MQTLIQQTRGGPQNAPSVPCEPTLPIHRHCAHGEGPGRTRFPPAPRSAPRPRPGEEEEQEVAWRSCSPPEHGQAGGPGPSLQMSPSPGASAPRDRIRHSQPLGHMPLLWSQGGSS